MKLIVFFLFLFSTIDLSFSDGHKCQVRFSYKKVCHRFKINSTCQPPYKTALCNRSKTTFEDSKCPNYICVRSFYNYIQTKQTKKFSCKKGKISQQLSVVVLFQLKLFTNHYKMTNSIWPTRIPCKMTNQIFLNKLQQYLSLILLV